MIGVLKNLPDELKEPVYRELNKRFAAGEILVRFTFTDFKDTALFLNSNSDGWNGEYHSVQVMSLFNRAEYDLLKEVSLSLDDAEKLGELKQRIKIMNQKTKRLVFRVLDTLEQTKKNIRWWKR